MLSALRRWVAALVQVFLDGFYQLFGSRYLATDCLFKVATFCCNCIGQPDLELDTKKQHRSQKPGRLRRARAQPGKCA